MFQAFVKSHTKLMLWLVMVPVMGIAVAIQHVDAATSVHHSSRSVMLNEYIPGMLWIAALLYSMDLMVILSKRYLVAIGASYIAPIAFAVAVFEFLPVIGHKFIPVPAPLVWLSVFGLLNVVVCRNFLRRRILTVKQVTPILSESLGQNTVANDLDVAKFTGNTPSAAYVSTTKEDNPKANLLVRLTPPK